MIRTATSLPTNIYRARAPIRIDFAGGWTDVPPFSATVGGAVVNATINRYTYATLVPRPTGDRGISIVSADFDTYVNVTHYRDLEYDGNLDLIKAAVKTLDLDLGMDLYVRCDAPPGSGTGSSSSIAVALVGLLNCIQSSRLSRHEVAQLARRMEVSELNIAGGKQDYYAAAHGGINFIEFQDPSVSSSPLHVPAGALKNLEKHLILAYTGQSRLSGNIISKVMDSYGRGEARTTEALHELKQIAHATKSALLSGDLGRFGQLLAANWECQKALDSSTTSAEIERLFSAALRVGALGGKACGAGGGGCVLFLADDNREHLVRKALTANGAQIIDFTFENEGLQTWQ